MIPQASEPSFPPPSKPGFRREHGVDAGMSMSQVSSFYCDLKI